MRKAEVVLRFGFQWLLEFRGGLLSQSYSGRVSEVSEPYSMISTLLWPPYSTIS